MLFDYYFDFESLMKDATAKLELFLSQHKRDYDEYSVDISNSTTQNTDKVTSRIETIVEVVMSLYDQLSLF